MRLPAFVMTLAMMTIARGLSLIISKGQPIIVDAEISLVQTFGSGFTLGIPNPVILMVAVYVVGGLVLAFTRFGRLIKAIGSNSEAVRLSGIRGAALPAGGLRHLRRALAAWPASSRPAAPASAPPRWALGPSCRPSPRW